MIGIVFSVLFGVLAYFFSKGIRKHFNIILVGTIILSSVFFFIDLEFATQGFLGLGLFVVVMYAGAFRKGSEVNKRLRSVRKEYSILGFLVLLPHAIKYLLEFLDGSYPVEWFGIIGYAVMIPLFIISFTKIKKKMKIKTWFKIQKWAYLAYLTIFIHLLVIGDSDHITAYIVIFGFYSLLKLSNDVFEKNSLTIKLGKAIGITSIAVLASLTYTGTIDASSFMETFEPVSIELSLLEDGIYSGEASGFKNYDVSLDVFIVDGEIIEINILEYGSTSPHGGINFYDAAEEMAENIIATQDTNVDSISGATKTTEGILNAVIDALD